MDDPLPCGVGVNPAEALDTAAYATGAASTTG